MATASAGHPQSSPPWQQQIAPPPPPLPPPLLLALLLALLLLNCPALTGAAEHVVHWNSTNPLFKPAGENLLTVQPQDRVIFVCPKDGVEFYQIYWTTSAAVSSSCSGGSLLFSCRRMDSYLVYVQIFPADPTAPGFNSPVYFYTPSGGDLLGMDQTQGGACLSRNMRLTVKIGNAAASSSTAAPPAAATPASEAEEPGDRRLDDRSSPHQTGAVAGQTTANNGRLSSRRPSDDKHQKPDAFQLNLITGSCVPAAQPALVAALSCFSAILLIAGRLAPLLLL